MRLHYWFFKYCQTSPQGMNKSAIFRLCNFDHDDCIGACVLETLTTMIFERKGWELLCSVFGEFPTWAPEYRAKARCIVLSLGAGVWRRFIKFYEAWPWKLVPLADPDVMLAVKLLIAAAFFSAAACCLDAAFSLKLRALLDGPEDLLEERWLMFLFHVFNKVVLSNARVECDFAHFKQWVMRSYKPVSLVLLQAKHMCHSCLQVHRGAPKDEPAAPPTKVRRPAWAMRSREEGRTTSRHLFIGEQIRKAEGTSQHTTFTGAAATWREAAPEVKREFKVQAQQRNAGKRAHKEAELQDAIQDLDAEHYPLTRFAVRTQMTLTAGVSALAEEWKARGTRVPEDPTFPEAVPYDHPCLQSSTSCTSELPAERQGIYADIFDSLENICAPKCLKTNIAENTIFIVVEADRRLWWLLRCFSCLRTRPFTGEFGLYTLGGDGSDDARLLALPCQATLSRKPITGAGSKLILSMMTEKDIVRKISMATAGPVEYYKMKAGDEGLETLSRLNMLERGDRIDVAAVKKVF